MNILIVGASRSEVLTGFVNFPEFQSHVDEVIAVGSLKNGTSSRDIANGLTARLMMGVVSKLSGFLSSHKDVCGGFLGEILPSGFCNPIFPDSISI